ncbi:serine/threonine protein kinase, CMGC, dual-specificity [Fusarium chlamydosporum]
MSDPVKSTSVVALPATPRPDPMSREHKAPAGPRPANFSPTRLGKTANAQPRPPLPSTNPGFASDDPMLSATPSNNHSLFSFSRDGEPNQLNDSTASFDFLPSVSFDDLQSSIESASTDFKLTQFPSPTGEGGILDPHGADDSSMSSRSQVAPSSNGAPTRPAVQTNTRPARSGSLLRRPSNSTRQPTNASGVSAHTEIANGPGTARSRRQSQYPPVSNTNAAKPPRKSIGPGIISDGDFGSRPAQKRRPSLFSEGAPAGSARTSMDGNSSWLENTTRNFSSSRAAKAKSVQPPPRSNQANLGFGNTLTPEQNRHSTLAPRSPRVGGRLSTPSSANKRVSMMPGAHHSSHATGLGARTISPTDTRRMKLHNPMPTDDDEYVPPVPAIPKAYESPKDSPADTYFVEKKKTALSNMDAMGANSNPTGVISMPVFPEPTKLQRKPSGPRSYVPTVAAESDNKATPPNKRHLQPLRLPPMNLGPLSTPTANKIAALQDQNSTDRHETPPPRHVPKTPTTPMTASKSSFFAKTRRGDTPELPSLRSSSSVHHTHLTPTPPDASSTESSLAFKELDHKQSMSPFLSSSLPKGGADHAFMKRSKTGADFMTTDASIFQDHVHHKPAGPRPPKDAESATSKSPPPEHTPEEPQTPSSMSSIRRKLSLSWKRGNSKSNTTASGDADKASAKQPEEPMPPPRIPVSATLNNLSNVKQASPSPNLKQGPGGYLDTRRRKSSGGSLNGFISHDKTKSDSWTAKKSVPDPSTMPVGRNTSVMQKILRPRNSSNIAKGPDSWSADLDKDDIAAEEEMAKLGSRRKETDVAARTLDALRKRATPKERVGAHEAIRIAMLNIYERGEIVDYTDVFFCGTQNAHKVVGDLQSDAPNFGYDDERGDYTIVPGDHLAYRYEIIDVLGKGSFGQVVRCIDHKTGGLVAIKIIRNKKRFHQQALVEVNILQKLREWDPKNKHSMVNFTQSFYFRGHLCISTELLDMNLYELIKAHAFRGFSIKIIRRFTKQILSSLNLLKQHKVIHCDLKPENILLRHPLHAEIKVIDFGSSCFENEKVYTYIQSRFYRSPEVILGMTYGMPIDMWSVGCILAELYTGVPIFPGENEQEQLACIMEVFGPPEKHLIEKSTRKKLFFDSMGKPRLTVSSKGRRRRPSSKTLSQVLKCDDEVFLDFLQRCLRWDPERRLKPEDAIRHEFITGRKMAVPRMPPTRESSPMKRHNTISTPRPLPDPPGTASKPLGSLRSGASPHKPVSGPVRKASGQMGPISSMPAKRTSAGTTGLAQGASGLPRAAGRSVSAKQDLAAAGATAAMSRRS